MASDWTLVEYRPGRYAKVSPTGAFLDKATEADVRAWFAAQGGRPAPAPAPKPVPRRGALPAAVPESRPSPPESKGRPDPPAAAEPPRRPQDAEPMRPAAARPADAHPIQARRETPPTPQRATAEPEIQTAEIHPAEARPGTLPAPKRAAAEAKVRPTETRPADARPETPPEPKRAAAEARVRATVTRPADARPETPPEIRARPADPDAVRGRRARPPEADTLTTEGAAYDDGAGRWLWVDPRRESGYQPSTFDLDAFLQRAVALFRAKAWTGGQKPRRLAVHPDQLTDGLKPVAQALGLEVIRDPLVSPGTYRLGLAEPGNGEQP
jgi:hypothetical protein